MNTRKTPLLRIATGTFAIWSLQNVLEMLLHLPDVVGLKQLGEVVVLLLSRDLFELCIDGIVVGGSIDVADNTQGDGEAIFRSSFLGHPGW